MQRLTRQLERSGASPLRIRSLDETSCWESGAVPQRSRSKTWKPSARTKGHFCAPHTWAHARVIFMPNSHASITDLAFLSSVWYRGSFGPRADIRIFRYFLQYRDHIGHDIGEKPDIWFGRNGYVPILTRYCSLYWGKTRYRARCW
jgi:hypothetical protein